MNTTFPLVAELVERGEKVIYYATEPYRERIEATGAGFRSYGSHDVFQPPAHRGGLYSVMAYEMGLAERVLPDLLQQLEDQQPDYLLIDSMCVWGNLLQQILKLPAIAIASVFVTNDKNMSIVQLVQMAYGQATGEILLNGIASLNDYFKISQRIDHRYGTCSPDIVQFFSNRQALNIVFTSREFHLIGEHFDDSYQFVGPLIAPRREQTDFPFDQLKPGPLVFISMGTIYNDRPDFYRACFQAFGDSPYQVVLSLGTQVDRTALGPAPANFIVRAYVPQLEILQRAALFVTHGGMNSTSEALWNEVPVIVIPQHGDQYLVAGQVAQLGAGLLLAAPEATPECLMTAAARVLSDPSFKQNAATIAKSFRKAGGVKRAVDEILHFKRKSEFSNSTCASGAAACSAK